MRRFSTLIVAEQFNGAFGNFKNVVTAATHFKEPVHVLVSGAAPEKFTEAVKATKGVDKVLVAKHERLENPLGDDLASISKGLISKNSYNRVLSASSSIGKDFLPRLGGLIDSQPITDVIKIQSEDTFVRPCYAGNALATVKSKDKVKLLTVRPTNFDAAVEGGNATVEAIDVSEWFSNIGSKFIENIVEESDVPELTAAQVVVAGGRSLGSAENFKILFELAKKLGNGAVGASRAAVDEGYISGDL